MFVMICAFNLGEEIAAAKDIFFQRKNTMPFIEELVEDYEDGKTLIWYEKDDLNAGNQYYQVSRSWQKNVVNGFCNYANRTVDKKFLMETREIESLSQDMVFLYSKCNANWVSLSADLQNLLDGHGFVLRMDIFNILLYNSKIPEN
jgi:hypothetical protein